MMTKYSMGLKALAEELEYNVVHESSDYETKRISSNNVSRPGLQFAGFYDYFTPEDIQVMGQMEISYLKSLGEIEREKALDVFFSKKPIALVYSNRLPPDIDIISCAKKYDVTVMTTDLDTSQVIAQIINSLRTALGARQTIHAVLVVVHGEGVLIVGDSGIGKSETALELIKRGHRLVSDDAVELVRMGRSRIIGRAPDLIKYIMELRGVGVVDIRRIYGASAILENSRVDMVVNLEHFDPDKQYDRLGLEDEFANYLGVKVPMITVPVAPGRNLAIILEIAAINNRLKRMGINTARELVENYDAFVAGNQQW